MSQVGRAALTVIAALLGFISSARADFIPRGAPTPQASMFMAVGPGFHQPQRIQVPATNKNSVVSRKHFCVDSARSNFMVAVQNFYITSGGGSADPELTPGNSMTVDWMFIAEDDGVTFVDSTEKNVTLADGGWHWFTVPAAISAGQCGYVVASYTVAPGATMVVQTKNDNGFLHEGQSFAATAQTEATFKNPSFNWTITQAFTPAPSMIVAQGWNGNAVYLLVGDSVCVAQASMVTTQRGNYGYLEMGLDDQASGRRAFANICGSGNNATRDNNLAGGYFSLRTALIQALPNVPFTAVLSEQGHNDGGDNIAQYGALYDGARGYWWQWTYLFNIKQTSVFQTTISGYTFSVLSDLSCPQTTPVGPPFSTPFPYGFTDTTHQCANTSNFSLPGGSVVNFSINMVGNVYTHVPASQTINLLGYMFGDPPYPHTWTSSDTNADHDAVNNQCGTLAANSLLNAGSVVINDPNPFTLYDTVGIAPATAAADYQGGLTITNMVDGGTTTTLTFSENYPGDGLAKTLQAHSIGDTICQIAAGDGVHFPTRQHIIDSGAIIAAKISNGGSVLP